MLHSKGRSIFFRMVSSHYYPDGGYYGSLLGAFQANKTWIICVQINTGRRHTPLSGQRIFGSRHFLLLFFFLILSCFMFFLILYFVLSCFYYYSFLCFPFPPFPLPFRHLNIGYIFSFKRGIPRPIILEATVGSNLDGHDA